MWLSKSSAPAPAEEDAARMGTVSMAAEAVAAVSDTEYRDLHLLSPGGYAWRPKVSDQVLILKDTVLGARGQCPVALQPGEACIFSDNCYIHLTRNGSIRLVGKLYINGQAQEG